MESSLKTLPKERLRRSERRRLLRTGCSRADRLGAFLSPDGLANGCIETLCRKAVSDKELAACVDALVLCAGAPHSVQAHADKGRLRAYLGMCADPNLRFHQALVAASGINPTHEAFDPLRAFLRAL